ncbi:M1 family metallopeptidase [Streptomyces liangshanensis]|uniref:M1 family metallopeptidase n=1 Tax=Streptomyces liangshanensis TaxID=2717324 RepID=UPI0036D9C29D
MRRYGVVSVALVGTVGAVGAVAGCGGGSGGGGRGTAGSAGVGDPYFPGLGNGGYDVSHYGLTLDYAPAGRHLDGTAVITARATQDLTSFHLDLAGMDVASVTVDGRRARVGRAGTELVVRPREELGRGATFRTVVRYSGVPRRVTDPDGSAEGWLGSGPRVVALGEPTGSMVWFPGNHHPSDKASYDIDITVPAGTEAVSNGELVSRRTSGGRTTFRWRTAEPMASYLATLAIGPYRVHEVKGPLPLYTAVDPAAGRDGADLVAALPGILAWEEKAFGPYPFSSAGVIIGRKADAGYALETQNRPFLPGPTDVGTLVHELAHQWFGDSVTPESWRDMWLNEGFATYTEWLWAADHGGVPVAESFAEAYDDEENWAFPPADPPTAADISEPPVYGRGAMVLQRVRDAVGDATFFRIVRGWARTHRHGNASTADFTAYVEKESGGRDLSGIWDGWLYGDGKPRL